MGLFTSKYRSTIPGCYNKPKHNIKTRLLKTGAKEVPDPSNVINCEEFNHWLAALIDGDGSFYPSREKYPGCNVSGHEDETNMLYLAQERFGGAVTRDVPRNGVAAKCFTWRLTGSMKMYTLLQALNGKIITPTRYEQFAALCREVGSIPQQGVLHRPTPWLAGFFDADGCVTVRRNTAVNLSITQKDVTVLEQFPPLWGGAVYYAPLVNEWNVGSTGPSLALFAQYLSENSRNTSKLRQLAVLQEVVRLRATAPVDKEAIYFLVNAFWGKKDKKRNTMN